MIELMITATLKKSTREKVDYFTTLMLVRLLTLVTQMIQGRRFSRRKGIKDYISDMKKAKTLIYVH